MNLMITTALIVSTLEYGRVAAFTVGVYDQAELLPVPATVSRQTALTILEHQLDIYRELATNASALGCVLLVLPEYGLMPLTVKTRDDAFVFTEQVPDPASEDWTPCLEPPSEAAVVQQTLSCIARNASLYIVANVGAFELCDGTSDPQCPADGRYQYNTNVVYDPTGRLISRYRKYHLFMHETAYYDTPQTADLVYFDTPFGRVGTFTCFDIIFEQPAMALVDQYNVSLVAFPTAWMNELPYYAAGPFHLSYGAGRRLHVMASNLHWSAADFCGSGIYSWDGRPLAFRCSSSTASSLLVADLALGPGGGDLVEVQPPSRPIASGVPEFSGNVFEDPFNFVLLRPASHSKVVCHNGLCCTANYTMQQGGTDQFALGAFRGLHTYEGQYYLEVCLVMACLDGTDTHCGEDATVSTTFFSFLNITGNFTTSYIYPQLVTSEVTPATDEWQFSRFTGSLQLSTATSSPLLSATLYARRFDLDGSLPSSSAVLITGTRWLLCALTLCYLAAM